MTEADWLSCEDVGDLLDFLRYSAPPSDPQKWSRKYRLFATACARRVWEQFGAAEQAAARATASSFSEAV